MASSKRERELARMRAERQAARRAAAEARRRKQRATLLAVVAAVAVVAVAVGAFLATRGGDKKDTVTSQPAPTAGSGTGTCSYAKSGKASKSVAGLPPGSGVRTTGVQKAVLTTSRGPIEATLLTSKAPCTVNSFAYLAGQKYFDGTPCHRLTTAGIYVLQCGDPSGTGSGGPGYKFADENLTGAVYPRGTLAMANAGPGTNGSSSSSSTRTPSCRPPTRRSAPSPRGWT